MDEAVVEEEANGGRSSDECLVKLLSNSFSNDVFEIGADFGVVVWT